MSVTWRDVKNSEEIRTYVRMANEILGAIGYTEHSFPHATRTAETACHILAELGYSEREAELAWIAGFMHDIGNCISRADHAQSGAIMAFKILGDMGMPPNELAVIMSAIGNHDEDTGTAVNVVSAALILADKSDVRRSRVRDRERTHFDIHDRVNYAVEKAVFRIIPDGRRANLELKIDTDICSVMDYFEIFLDRMLMCRRAADYLNIKFELVINDAKVL